MSGEHMEVQTARQDEEYFAFDSPHLNGTAIRRAVPSYYSSHKSLSFALLCLLLWFEIHSPMEVKRCRETFLCGARTPRIRLQRWQAIDFLYCFNITSVGR